MLIVNMVILGVILFGVGYYLGNGKIEITVKANKADSAKMIELQEEVLRIQKEMEADQKKHLEEYNEQFG